MYGQKIHGRTQAELGSQKNWSTTKLQPKAIVEADYQYSTENDVRLLLLSAY